MDLFLLFLKILVYIILVIGPFWVLYLWYQIVRDRKYIEWLSEQEHTTLLINVPKNNDKTPLAAEQMFASLHGIFSKKSSFQSQISFEIVSQSKYIRFYAHLPKYLKDFVEGQIYAQYPTIEIKEVDDYIKEITLQDACIAGCELILNKPDVYPIKTAKLFEVDPLAGITSTLTKLSEDDQIMLQYIIKPIDDNWQHKGLKVINSVRAGNPLGRSDVGYKVGKGIGMWGKMLLSSAVSPGAEVKAGEAAALSSPVEAALKAIEEKILKLGFKTIIRIVVIGKDPVATKMRVSSVVAAFKQFNTTNLNGFIASEITLNNAKFWDEFRSRLFQRKGNIFNIEELASIFHFPNVQVETPNIVWSGSKKGEPPSKLPLMNNNADGSLTLIGKTNFRNSYHEFGMKMLDRMRHTYVVGKSGTGKSTLLENMAVDDIRQGRGVIIVDPHGEFAEKALSCVPKERIADVVIIDPSDRAFPVALNLLENVDDDYKGMVASGFVGIFKKIFGQSWGPRLEHILRNTVLALLDYPESTMLDIPRMLTEKKFRDKVIESVKDPVIQDFWLNEFAAYDNKFRTEAVSPILNKVGQFLATATIRNIVGQSKSSLDMRKIMDEKKIMIINLSRGKIGEDNSAFLGAMIITKVQLAAMSRADVALDQRPECFMYVDEFQNFATESFAVILSEARKYNLSLTMANQYITQMSEEVRDAVFGNVGTMITFRVGATDAAFLVKEFAPVFSDQDLVNLDKYQIYIKLLIDGIASPAFSCTTLPPVKVYEDYTVLIKNVSRQQYSKSRETVETGIVDRLRANETDLKAEAEAFMKGGLAAITAPDAPARIEVVPEADTRFETNKDRLETPKAEVKIEAKASQPEVPKPIEKAEEQGSDKKNDSGEEEKKPKPKAVKLDNLIDDLVYKEQTAKGGVKWYVGEKVDMDTMAEQGYIIDDSFKEAHKLAKLATVK
jgi:hypothetical protein